MTKLIYLIPALAMLVSACGEDAAPQQQTVAQTAVEPGTDSEEQKVTYILPSPYQIAEIFRRAGLNYQPGVTLTAEQTASFNSSFHKNLAFGMYSADLAYTLVNKQSQESITYLKVIRGLANDLGYGKVFDSESFFTRFEKNIGNEDSVAFLLGDLQIAMTDLLNQNNEDYISPIIFASAWIESMYIGVQSYDKNKTDGLLSKLEEQEILLENVLASLQQHQEKFAGIPALVKMLQEIQNQFPAEEDSRVDFNALKQAVTKARTDIIEGNLQA